MNKQKYADLLKRSKRLIYSAGWEGWQQYVKENMEKYDPDGAMIEKMIVLMELLEDQGFEVAGRYLSGEKSNKEQMVRILNGAMGYAKKGPSFGIYYVDNYGEKKLPDQKRLELEKKQESYDEIGKAEDKKREKEKIERELAALQEQLEGIKAQIASKTRELQQLEGK